MNIDDYLGKDIPKLGFRLMRLPRIESADSPMDGPADLSRLKEMVDLFLDAGCGYFDTASVFDDSEKAIKEALVDRYPRERYQLATELFPYDTKKREDVETRLHASLKSVGVEYFDYCLIDNISVVRRQVFEESDIWVFLLKQKEQGLLKHLGLAFYDDTPETLDEILTKYPQVEFVQLQINYGDWESYSVQSRACYEVARNHAKPIIAMDPFKGGSLISLPPAAKAALTGHNPEASQASWGLRYAASIDGVITVLTGMRNVEHMKDNLATLSHLELFNDEEHKALTSAVTEIQNFAAITCTHCGFCLPYCPKLKSTRNYPGRAGSYY